MEVVSVWDVFIVAVVSSLGHVLSGSFFLPWDMFIVADVSSLNTFIVAVVSGMHLLWRFFSTLRCVHSGNCFYSGMYS